MRLHYPLNPTTGVEDQAQLPWTDGVPQTSQEGSFPPSAAVVEPMTELVNLLGWAGLTGTSSDLNQVTRAVRGGQLDFDATDTGTADAVLCQIGLPHTAVKPGLPFTFIKGPNDNTGNVAPTLTITDLAGNNGVSGQITKKNGKALAAGDLPANSMITVRADTNGNFRLIAAVLPSDVVQQVAATAIVPAKVNVTLWVRSDSTATAPDGSSNDPAHAFPTIAAAIIYGASKFSFSSFALIVRLGVAGTYAPPGPVGGVPNLQIISDTGNTAAFIVSGGVAGSTSLFNIAGGCSCTLSGFTINVTAAANGWVSCGPGGGVYLTNLAFTDSVTSTSPVIGAGGSGANVTIGPGITVNAVGAAALLSSSLCGTILVAAYINMIGGSAFTTTVTAADGGQVKIPSNVGFTGAGAATVTGQRYNATGGGANISVSGAGANAIPGNSAGTTSNNGTYG